jgi:hypothetical protein
MPTQTLTVTTSAPLNSGAGKPPINLTGDPLTIGAITANTAFPAAPGADVVIGQLSASTPSGASFNMPGVGESPVSFQGSASADASLAAYTNSAKLASDLGFQSGDGKQLKVGFPSDPKLRYMVLKWDFDASGSASGKMALDPAVSVSFGLNGAANGEFAFIRAVDAKMLAGDACTALLQAWCTPAAIASGNRLPPGCWIVTEVDGQLGASLGIVAGYDFNWVKALALNDLDGDIGLRISAGLNATLTAQLAGKYFLVLNREGTAVAPVTRLRLFRTTTNGWGFALNASASVTPSTGTFPPANLDGFIKAVLGIHDAQLLSFLNPLLSANSVNDVENAVGAGFLQALDLTGDVKKGFSALQKLMTQWNNLPNSVSSTVWKHAGQIGVLADLHSAASELSTLGATNIQSLLDTWLHDSSFQSNPVCEWLESASSQTLFELYESEPTQIRQYAQTLLSVLDGSELQNTLNKLQSQVDTVTNLQALQTAITNNNLAGVAVWVKQQLAKFLGVDFTGLTAQIGKINQVIATIQTRANDIYTATTKALNTTYGANLAYAYNASDTQSALIDVSFADTARGALGDAILGRFGTILTIPAPGITLNTGTLTHGISRHTHVSMDLPWWKCAADDLATGSATGTFVDGVGNRVQFFEASASDVDTVQTNTNVQRFATCSMGISGAAAGVRKYNVSAVNFGYSFVTMQQAMTVSQLEYDLSDPVEAYFKNNPFGNPNSPQHANFDIWLSDLDKFTDATAGLPNGTSILGTVWERLQVNVHAQQGVDWVGALLNGAMPNYYAMSLAMQTQIRKWLLKSYSANPSNFKTPYPPFLVYTALPALNDISLDGNGNVTYSTPPKGPIYWDCADVAKVAAVCCEQQSINQLQSNLRDIAQLLNGIPGLRGSAQFYDGQAQNILSSVVNASKPIQAFDPIVMLLLAESNAISKAQSAFHGLSKAGSKQLQPALQSFAAAVVNLVTAFNKSLTQLSLSAPDLMRYFAPIVFQQAVQAMLPGASAFQLDALLDIAVLKNAALPSTADAPSPDKTYIWQTITSFSKQIRMPDAHVHAQSSALSAALRERRTDRAGFTLHIPC